MANKKGIIRLGLGVSVVGLSCALLISWASAAPMNPIPGDPIMIDSGEVAGTLLKSGVRAYLGIPYAEPPVRELRWRPPVPVKPWSGVYNADSFGPACPQTFPGDHGSFYFGEFILGEDCLHVNVWTPPNARRGAKLPVVVWIYGGGFQGGATRIALYDGESLAKKGLVYVSIDYRIGVFGFLAHPELTKESDHEGSGDYGFMDQIAGLKWVERNIGAFGGDTGNVTLLGESAGSMSLNELQASPLARGLFERVFGMSGTFISPGGQPNDTLQMAEAKGMKLQEALKASSIEGMREVPWDKLAAVAQEAGVRPWPDVDGYVVPEPTADIFAQGKQNDVAVMASSTGKDLFSNNPIGQAKNLAEYKQIASQVYGDDATAFLEAWPASNDEEALKQAHEIIRDSGFGLAARDWARLQTLHGKQPAFLVTLTRVQPFAAPDIFTNFNTQTAGAYHSSDIGYWLGTYPEFNRYRQTIDWTSWDRELSDKMQDAIVAFSETGNPSTPKLKIPKYDPGHEQRIVFGDKIYVETLNTSGLNFLEDHPIGRPGAGPGGR